MTQAAPRRLPVPQAETEFYWEKARAHELWLMRCDDCNQAYFYPRSICPLCFSRNTRWFQATGKGTLFAFSVVFRAPRPEFTAPYIAAMVELEEGPRMPTNLVGVEADPTVIHIGTPVEVVFEDLTDQIALPKFRPIS